MIPSVRTQFLKFIKKEQLFDKKEKVLLAVSGGIDSVAMAHLFFEAGLDFGIAHCNFGLRGKESDEDEVFVKKLAEKYNAPFYSTRFATLEYVAGNNVSIQMAARELRYAWFEEIRAANGYAFIATAHHKNDSAETILLNLSKGAILKGIQGIPAKNGHIVRPLLWADKEEILNYIHLNNLPHREDASNAEDKYQRNLIRNKIIPLLKEINPSVIQSITDAAAPRKAIEKWYEKHIESIKEKAFGDNGFSIPKLIESGVDAVVLYYLLEPYGLNYSQAEELFEAFEATEPKNFYTASNRIIKDRDSIQILPLEAQARRLRQGEGNNATKAQRHKGSGTLQVGKDTSGTLAPGREEKAPTDEICRIAKIPATVTFNGFNFSFEWIDMEDINDIKNPKKAFLDLAKITFPIQIRKWERGDYFYPLGLGKKKNISDFLTDIKIPAIEKENQLVVVSGKNIIWVAGRRPDDRYKVTAGTRKVVKIEQMKSEKWNGQISEHFNNELRIGS